MPKSESTSHPGKILNEQFLKTRSISITQFSNQTGISKRHLNEIINSKRAISKSTADILAKKLNTSTSYWLDLQANYDNYIARKLLKGIIPDDDAIEKVMINNPHDKIIKIVFSDRNEAVEFFQKNMPHDLVEQIDWDTLELEGSKYIDEEFKDSESDLLYSVNFKNEIDKCFLYLLFEHQSKPDKWLRYRIIKYKTRIWDETFKKHKNQEMLIPILPMVFYIGTTSWNYSPQFSDIIYKTPINDEYIPKFKHVLWDFSNESIEFKGAIKAKLAYLLIQSYFHDKFKEIFQVLLDYFSLLQQSPGINYIKVFFIYLAATQKHNDLKDFIQLVRNNQNQNQGEKNMIKILDELRFEGIQKGIQEGQLKEKFNIINNMLNENMDWSTIYKITGVDNSQFEELKLKQQKFQTMQIIAGQNFSNNDYLKPLDVHIE